VQDAWNTINEQSDHLEVLAANTGGFVVGRSNTFASGIAQMFRESGSYYLLGFRPPRPPDGRRRRIEVRVDHPGAIVRSREGYAEPRPPRPGRAPAPVAAAMAGLLPATDLPLRVTLTPFAQPGRKDVAVLVTLGLQRPAPEAAIDELVRLLVRAFTPEGRNVRGRTLDARLALRPGAGDAKYEIHSRLDLPPGRYAVRVSAESTTLKQTGSVYADLIVPDFSKGAVSLSGVVIASEPPLRSAGGDTHDNLVPVLPTTQREFAGHAATAFIRVYQGGKAALQPITLRARIVDANGTQVFEEARTLDAVQFAPTRSADYRLELPVRDLAAGAYLLTIEATAAGQVARREVRFEAR
jgi:hypothetical protein